MSKGAEEQGIVKFRALQLANEHRNAYGLRYNDYNRYRNHCGNRTHRLRSSLKMTHGKGRDFKKLPPITLENVKDGHLQLLLFEAERAWAYSQELYNASLQSSNRDSAKLRHSATGRFRRAIHWSTQLLSLCQSLYSAQRFSAGDMTEATAYTLILSGRFLRYRDEFDDALDQLCVARDLLDELTSCARNSKDQALATLFSDEISPEIRYCAHQLGHAKSYDVDGIVKEVSPKQRKVLVEGYDRLVEQLNSEAQKSRGVDGHGELRALIWDGQTIPVRNPELVDVLLEVQKAEDQLKISSVDKPGTPSIPGKKQTGSQHRSRKGVAAFDALLAALSESEEVARKLAEARQSTGGSASSSGPARDIHFLHAFIVYRLLSVRIQRDLTLVSALIGSSSHNDKHQDGTNLTSKAGNKKEQTNARVNPAIVKLLDTVLQSLTHMRNLSIVDESPDLANAVEVRLSFTKSQRCLFLSRSYAVVKEYAQAITLARKADIFVREALSLFSHSADPINESNTPYYVVTSDTINDLVEIIKSSENDYRLDWFAYSGGLVKPVRDESKKPLFFDIALNYAQLDMDKLQERAGMRPKVTSIPIIEPKLTSISKTKAEEVERPATPEPSAPGGVLNSLLGGWWGRR